VNPTLNPPEPAEKFNVTFRGKEVVNPGMRWFTVYFSIIGMLVLVGLLTVLSPLLVLLQLALKAMRRRGLILYYPDDSWKLDISMAAFGRLHE
jgi:hypothetical protein